MVDNRHAIKQISYDKRFFNIKIFSIYSLYTNVSFIKDLQHFDFEFAKIYNFSIATLSCFVKAVKR